MNQNIQENLCRFFLCLAVLIYTVIFCFYCFTGYKAFGYFDWDLATYSQAVWGLTHGDTFPSILGVNFFGHHAHFLAIPTAVLYWIFPTPLTLLYLQTFALAAAAFPLYFLARKFLSCYWALLISCLYLVHPGILNANAYEFHFTVFIPLILFFMFYFFYTDKYIHFIFWTILALLCQENISLLIFMFGIFAMYSRKSVRWWGPLLLVSVGYFIFCVKVLFPNLNPGKIQFISIYRDWGHSYGEIIRNILTHPLQVFQYMFTPVKLKWLERLFAPLFFIPLMSPVHLLLAVPLFVQRFLSNRQQETVVLLHYQLEILPVVFLAMIFGLKRFFGWSLATITRRILLFLFLLSLLLYLFVIFPRSIDVGIRRTKVTREEVVKEQWVKSVPPDASVVATFQFLSHLSNRKDLYSFHYLYTGTYILSSKPYVLNRPVDVALIDFNDDFLFGSFYSASGYLKIRSFLDAHKFSVEDVANNMVLFRREGAAHKKLFEEMRTVPLISNPLDIVIKDSLRLAGYDVQRHADRLELILYWQVLKRPGFDLSSDFVLFDLAGKNTFEITSPACYRIFPTQAWNENTWVVEHKYLLIPSELMDQDFSLALSFFEHRQDPFMPFMLLRDFKGVK